MFDEGYTGYTLELETTKGNLDFSAPTIERIAYTRGVIYRHFDDRKFLRETLYRWDNGMKIFIHSYEVEQLCE